MFEDNFKDDHDCKNNKCVCKTVRKIAAAQDEVAGTGDGCDTGCKQSINDLLSPTTRNNGNDTIPFILYCKKGCKAFIGSSVVQTTVGQGQSQMTALQCLETPIFRVSRVKDNCCAELELLLPVNAGGQTPGPGGDTVCDFFPGEGNAIRNLQRTGVCITVDLCDFMGIACLDPVRALPVADMANTMSQRGGKKD